MTNKQKTIDTIKKELRKMDIYQKAGKIGMLSAIPLTLLGHPEVGVPLAMMTGTGGLIAIGGEHQLRKELRKVV